MSPGDRLLLGFGALLVVGMVTLGFRENRKRPLPPVVNETDPDDASWVLARIEACDRVCGGVVPFEVEATRESFRCTCQRPASLGKVRLPAPRAPAVAAQVLEAQ